MNKNVTEFKKGLAKNNSPIDTEKGSYLFALNAINTTKEGDENFLSNEESNNDCFKLPLGYVPLGKVYIGDGEVAILSHNPDTGMDEIGIVNSYCEYTTHVNHNLNFKITNQIDLTYRLRNGCGKTIYWVDGKNNPPMNFIFGSNMDFQTAGIWDINKFYLESSFSIRPEIDSIEVLEGVGFLLPGSINVGIQYVNENFNATAIITTSSAVNIYNSPTTGDYLNIQGSTTSDMSAFNSGPTSKAIKVTSILDTSFKYYRLVFVEFNSGTGQLTSVKYTDNIPTSVNEYIFDGKNFLTSGAKEDLLLGGKMISSGDSIEQIDNRLIIANTSGQTGDPCSIQKFISEINSDLIIKRVSGDKIEFGNTKNPTVHFEAVGYMPKEIYSFGFVPIYEDNTEGPVYHIPGKNPNYGNNHIFSPGPGVYPMSINNNCENATYLENNSCASESYWGVDSYGEGLVGEKVRHHRFPSRVDIGVPMVDNTEVTDSSVPKIKMFFTASGVIDIPCTADQVSVGICPTLSDAPDFQIRFSFKIDGVYYEMYLDIKPGELANYPSLTSIINSTGYYEGLFGTTVTEVKIEEESSPGVFTEVLPGTTSAKGLVFTTGYDIIQEGDIERKYFINVYGIKFSNIDLVGMNLISDKKIIGYNIVRNERTVNNKTILDSGILTPCVNSSTKGRYLWGKYPDDAYKEVKVNTGASYKSDYLSNGLLLPIFDNTQIGKIYNGDSIQIGTSNFLNPEERISREFFGLLHPLHKFKGIEYTSLSRISQEGTFRTVGRYYSSFQYQDVIDGTTYDSSIHKNRFKDDDGYLMLGALRDSRMDFELTVDHFNFDNSEIKEITYLNAVEDRNFPGTTQGLWNLSADNKTGIIRLNDNMSGNLLYKYLPYVYLEKDLQDPYSDFRSLPYYKVSQNLEDQTTAEIFEGDVFIAPMRYFSSLFLGEQPAFRVDKNATWKIVVGVVLSVAVAVAVVVASITLPALASALVSALPATIGLITAGISEQKLIDAYGNKYNSGLAETLIDADTFDAFKWLPTEDDQLQWFGEVISDLWFESEINISLRHDLVDKQRRYFLDAPGILQSENSLMGVHPIKYLQFTDGGLLNKVHLISKYTDAPTTTVGKYFKDKLLETDTSRKDGQIYVGLPKGEIYAINPDFDRMNKQKEFFHLGIEYDCCSDCGEDFPHRVWYSEQSFQEELSDNFKTFLPQNYRDIEGETGRITDLFKIDNNLYIHTEEALWHLPQNLQEKITDQLTTFIGTGEFFAIPPRKILDDEQASAGTHHKWATNKNETGVYFISEKESKFYRFDGRSLNSVNGKLDKWFQKNIPLKSIESFKKLGMDFRNFNNPSNPFGTGFISIYDSENKRVIFTKKDYKVEEDTLEEGSCYCSRDGIIYINPNYQNIIDLSLLAENPADFLYLEGCDMVFEDQKTKKIIIIDPIGLVKASFEEGFLNTSWTLSYDTSEGGNNMHWVSWHSYLPNFYFKNRNKFYSWINDQTENNFWLHGIEGSYQNFYGIRKPFIVEYVSMSEPLKTKIWDDISIHTEAKKYNSNLKEYNEEKNVTFNKGIFYNSRQCTGELTFKVKDLQAPEEDFMIQQVTNLSPGTVIIDRNEKDWHINDIRDIRVDYNSAFFSSSEADIQSEYFIDKILNNSVLNVNKDWSEQESLRDKYLVVRLIFDTFDDVKLILNYTIESEVDSF